MLLSHTKKTEVGIGEHDQLDWAAEKTITAYGVRVGLRANEPEILDRFLRLIPDIWRPASSQIVERRFSLCVGEAGRPRNSRSFHYLYEDDQIVASSADMDSVLDSFESHLKMYLAEMARGMVFVHAGAVGWRGKAIIVPGRSLSGKTSLVAELVRAGATYYSDEYAVLDKYGRVHPYLSPLAVRDPGSFKQRRCPVEEFGGVSGTEPLRAGLVIVTRYKSGEHWHPRRLTAGQAMLELLANTVPARRNPEAVIATLNKALADAMALKGERGEAEETACIIIDHLPGAHRNTNRI